jgi:diguanylate cyclase (GGDEF)-like protein/PAS domain S-box-containing protein
MIAHRSRSPERPRETRAASGLGPLPWVAVGAIALFIALTSLFEGDAPGWTAFDNIGELAAAAAGTAACWTRASRERSLYRSLQDLQRHGPGSMGDVELARQTWIAWTLLAIGVGAWAAGQLGWTIYEVGFGVKPPSPSGLDGLFLLSPLLVVTGLLAMVRTPAGHISHMRGALEALFIAAGVFLLSWSLIGHSILTSESSLMSRTVNLAYPTLDAVALAAVLFVAVRRSKDPPAGLGLLALGIACVAVSDSGFLYLSAVANELPGATPLDSGWVAGFLLIALAAMQRGTPDRLRRRLQHSRVVPILPAMPAALGILAVVAIWIVRGNLQSENVVLSILGVVVLLAVALLQIVFYENRALMGNLEELVEQRTVELHATERHFRALVQRSSDIVMVVGPDRRIRYVSDSIAAIFGFSPGQVVGARLEVFGKGSAHALSDALDQVEVTPGQVMRVQWTLTDPTGRTRRAESTIANLLADPNVGAFVVNTRDDTYREALQEQLRHQAFHDPLTMLANRALLTDRASQALARSRRTGSSVAVMALDIDSFKLVNDRLGHLAGDQLLRAIARRLRAAVRPEDTVARIGGDEFVVLVDTVEHADDALALAQRVHDAMRPPFDLGGEEQTITLSIGVAIDVAPHSNFEQLLSDADVAMYAVKSAGRDAIQLYEPSMHERARERFRMQAELREGIKRGEMRVLYQPVFGGTDRRLAGFEALVRWRNPTRGELLPERFVPLAEETGLIVPLGRWVLREALREATSWDGARDGGPPLSISVNVSAVQIGAPTIVDDVREALELSEIDPARVVLEVTESTLIDSSPRVVEVLRELKALGVRLAIDDFGTGYASISYLQRIPVDILKVDQSFVERSESDERGRELLQAILDVGHALSLVTVAEGVEQPNQLEALKDAGCDLVQGHLLSHPLSREDVASLIASGSGGLQGAAANP